MCLCVKTTQWITTLPDSQKSPKHFQLSPHHKITPFSKFKVSIWNFILKIKLYTQLSKACSSISTFPFLFSFRWCYCFPTLPLCKHTAKFSYTASLVCHLVQEKWHDPINPFSFHVSLDMTVNLQGCIGIPHALKT